MVHCVSLNNTTLVFHQILEGPNRIICIDGIICKIEEIFRADCISKQGVAIVVHVELLVLFLGCVYDWICVVEIEIEGFLVSK